MRRPALVAVLLLGACSGPQAVLDPAADQAGHILDVWTLMLWVCGLAYALVLLFLAFALLKARKALEPSALDEDIESPRHRRMARMLTGWGAFVVIGLTVLTAGSFLVDRSLAMASQADALRVKVTANQWWWKVEYQDPTAGNRVTTANELHLPVGRPVLIELTADDVIHSFWIPNLAGKQDLIPGRTNQILITPRRVGTYRGQCAEFCGLEHAQMALVATVERPAAFDAWRAAQRRPARAPATPQELHGQALFLGGPCATCHAIAGTDAYGQTGPDLTHFATRPTLAAGALRMTPTDVRLWLADPQAVKPGVHMPVTPLTQVERDDLVAYLMSLK